MKQFPNCEDHEESEKELLWIRENDVKLCCSQCICQQQDDNHRINMKNFIHLKMIQLKPEEFYDKIIPQPMQNIENPSIVMNQLSQLIKLQEQYLGKILELKKSIGQLYENAIQQLQESKTIQQEMRGKLIQVLQIDQFLMNISEISKNTGETQGDKIEQIQNSLFSHINECKQNTNQIFAEMKDIHEIKKNQLKILVSKIIPSFSNLATYVNQLFKDVSFEILPFSSSLVNSNYFQLLIKLVNLRLNCQITQINKIFLGSEDGLTFKQFGSKVIGKEKLLMIFQSSSGSIFGAFTPCKWSCQNKFHGKHSVSDDTVSSFLFSYTLQEIYPIKTSTKQFAQYFGTDYIIFGGTAYGDQDLRFDSNFANGMSRLGVAYEAKGKDNSVNSTFLFGGLQPNVIECEIYQLI